MIDSGAASDVDRVYLQLEFEGFDGRRVMAAFDGGAVTSDAGAVLLRETHRAIGLIGRVAACFSDGRDPGQLIHALPTLVGQRIVAIALGYEDVNDHDRLRFDERVARDIHGHQKTVARTVGDPAVKILAGAKAMECRAMSSLPHCRSIASKTDSNCPSTRTSHGR